MLFTAAGLLTGNWSWSRVFALMVIIVCLGTPPISSQQIPGNQPLLIRIDTESHRSEAFEVRFDRPVLSNSIAEKQLNAWISGIVDDFSAESIANISPGDTPNTLEGRVTHHTSVYPFLSVKFSIKEYNGGGHSNTYIETFVFDMETGHRLGLADLFTRPGQALEAISTTAVRQMETASGNEPHPMARDSLLPMERYFQYFNLGQNGITFFFPVYQTDTRTQGEQRITTPYAGLKQWMAPGIKEQLYPSPVIASQ
ncbi:MAG: hypothetical protein GY737_04800 [Desulfobacteraceae bacterium]|nr:hypothetical protein [Desulfobacteraceae bacterium]